MHYTMESFLRKRYCIDLQSEDIVMFQRKSPIPEKIFLQNFQSHLHIFAYHQKIQENALKDLKMALDINFL